MRISLLGNTATSFSSQVQALLGKGFQHATMLYSSWMRQGNFVLEKAVIGNAASLIEEIIPLCSVDTLPIAQTQQEGETTKFLLRTHDGLDIESVLIPMKSGATLCVSSQVGCRMGCLFCETGRMGLLRNLTAEEIVNQLFVARHKLGLTVRNIVFMGMGEPFDNYDEVLQAVKILTDPKGFGFGRTQITVSTSGVIEGIYRLIDEDGEMPNLAVSISAAEDLLRNKIMPINRKLNLQKLYEAMHTYNSRTNRQILAAYVMLKDVNDSVEHAEKLAQYLKGLNVKINVIPYNAQKRDQFASSESSTIDAFVEKLRSHGYYVLLRRTKGSSIMAACGQLGNVKQKQQLIQMRREAKE